MKGIKIAQIGTSINNHGNATFISLKKQTEYFEVIGYALPEKEREKFPSYMKDFEGFQEMTAEEILNNSEIEAVAVETEEIYLTKYALMVAESGKHIHKEKPGDLGLTDFERLIALVKQKN